jgi:soluble lytic murein transglycosylase
VRTLLEPVVANASGADIAARYMLARAYAASQMWQQSLEQYDAYIASGRPAVPYALLDRGRVLMELDRHAEAATSITNGLAQGVPPSQKRAFVLATAQAQERAGALNDAIRSYNQLIDVSDLPGDEALALSRIAAIKKAQGNASWSDEWNRLLRNYPSTSQALNELNDAIARGDAVDPYVRGLIYYRNNDYTKAEPAFRAQITAQPDAPASAESYYYVGAILESRGDYEGAAANYTKTGSLNPQSFLADDALWWRARLLEDAGKLDEARPLYARIVTEYAGSSWAPEAAFRRGLLAYSGGKYQDAVNIWAEGLAAATDATERQRLTFWQAKALIKGNNRDGAKPLLERLASANEDDYYGVRAASLLANKQNLPKASTEAKVDFNAASDYAAAESWLASRTARPVSDAGWSADNRWARAEELWLVGRSSQGDGEAFDLIEAYARDPIAMYTMARTMQREGRIGMSARAGQRLLRTLDTNPNAGLPKALLALSYPPAFGTFAQRYAAAEKISPLLLLAFVRQESFFDPRAESPAGALGLTQVLPNVGKSTATKLGISGVDDETLLEADLNLRVGARYMADQLKQFNNEVFVALAAYNAGANAAQRWRKTSGDDADLFLETIEFSESRLYVEIVSENYAIYRYLYAGESIPGLP